jgi:Dolichyl-phosphate-mannose-protein mannosyltransferase
VGYAIDDALYILGAQALLGGRYINLCLPGHIPLTDPLPGFSLFIAPFVALVQPHWLYLKIVVLAMTLLSGVLIYRLFRSSLTGFGAAAVWILFAFNPTTVNFSGIVVSEPCFLLFALLIFLLLEKILQKEEILHSIFLGVLLGWAGLIRPQGIALLGGIGLAVVLAKRWRVLLSSIGTGLVVWGFILITNDIMTRSPTGYVKHWQATLLSIRAAPILLFQNATQVTKTLLAENILGLPAYPASTVYSILVSLLALGSALLIISGLVIFIRGVSLTRTTRLAMIFFVALYYGVHLAWLAVDVHYLYPILPFSLVFLVMGWNHWACRLKLSHFWTLGAFAFLLIRYIYCDVYAIPGVIQSAFQVPSQTYDWMHSHIIPTSLVYSPAAATVRLYTGCYAMYASPPPDMNSFQQKLLDRGITYVLDQPVNLQAFSHYQGLSTDVNAGWAMTEAWVRGHPSIFRPTYSSAEEGTVLYSVAKN